MFALPNRTAFVFFPTSRSYAKIFNSKERQITFLVIRKPQVIIPTNSLQADICFRTHNAGILYWQFCSCTNHLLVFPFFLLLLTLCSSLDTFLRFVTLHSLFFQSFVYTCRCHDLYCNYIVKSKMSIQETAKTSQKQEKSKRGWHS